MRKIQFLVFFLTGFGFLFYGILAIGWGIFIMLPTRRVRERDQALARQIYDESLERGDEWSIANLEATNTASMSNDARIFGVVPFVAGCLLMVAGIGICYIWWNFVLNPLIH